MGESSAHNHLQFWAEGPHICNADAQLMAHYIIQAVCIHEGCEETIPFTMAVGRDMRKHFNEKHRLLCKACKKEAFSSKEDLEKHLKSTHGDSFCSECHTSFTLTSSIAMHIESPRNSCSVTPQALASALRRIQAEERASDKQKDETDPNAVYSPISCNYGDLQCSPEEIMFKKLKDFRRTLLRAHKEVLSHKRQEIGHPPSPASGTTSVHNNTSSASSCAYDVQSPPESVVNVKGIGFSSYAASPSSLDIKSLHGSGNHESPRLRGDRDRLDQENWEWTCAFCMVKFTTLSKLLQHVEARVKESWWKSMLNK